MLCSLVSEVWDDCVAHPHELFQVVQVSTGSLHGVAPKLILSNHSAGGMSCFTDESQSTQYFTQRLFRMWHVLLHLGSTKHPTSFLKTVLQVTCPASSCSLKAPNLLPTTILHVTFPASSWSVKAPNLFPNNNSAGDLSCFIVQSQSAQPPSLLVGFYIWYRTELIVTVLYVSGVRRSRWTSVMSRYRKGWTFRPPSRCWGCLLRWGSLWWGIIGGAGLPTELLQRGWDIQG